jgi:hypothetical protein
MAERTGFVLDWSSGDMMDDDGVAVPAETSSAVVVLLLSSEPSKPIGEGMTFGAGGLSSRSPASHAQRRAFHRSGPVTGDIASTTKGIEPPFDIGSTDHMCWMTVRDLLLPQNHSLRHTILQQSPSV